MSLEIAIQANTAAINALIDAIRTGNTATAVIEKAATVKKSPTPTAEATAAPAESGGTSESNAKALTYDDIKKPFLKLVETKRETALAILKEYDAPKLTGIPPEHFAEVLGKINAALG